MHSSRNVKDGWRVSSTMIYISIYTDLYIYRYIHTYIHTYCRIMASVEIWMPGTSCYLKRLLRSGCQAIDKDLQMWTSEWAARVAGWHCSQTHGRCLIAGSSRKVHREATHCCMLPVWYLHVMCFNVHGSSRKVDREATPGCMLPVWYLHVMLCVLMCMHGSLA